MRFRSSHRGSSVPARVVAALLVVQLAFPLSAAAQMEPKAQPPGAAPAIGQVTLFGEEQPKVEAATKTELPLSKAPTAVTVITAKQIRESGAKTVPDLLRLVGGVNVRWNPMGPTIDVRGFGENPFSNRLLLLIDGIPYNSGDTGGFPLSPAYDFFPVQNIKRIEVVKGPGSSLYGENAYWGVINIVTLAPEDVAGGASEIYAGGRRGTSSITAMYGDKLGANSSLLASARVMRTEFPMEFWHDDRSKFRATDVFLKGGHRDWQFTYYRHDDKLDGFAEEFGGEGGFPPGSEFASAHKLTQTLDIATLKYAHQRPGDALSFSADVSYSHRNGMHCAGCHAAQEEPHFAHPANHGYQLIGDFRLGVHNIPGHDILLGVEGRRLDRAAHQEELAADAHTVSGYDKLAVYAQDQFSFLRDQLRIVAGLRYDGKTQLFKSETSPRLSAVWTPNDRTVLRAGYSTAFRFPNFSELYQSSWFLTLSNGQAPIPPFPIAVFVPNETLRPEEIRNVDVGGEYQLSPSLSARVDLYRSRVKNFMVIGLVSPPGGAPGLQYFNQQDSATVRGGELELRTNLTQGITGYVNYAHQTESRDRGALDPAGNPLEFAYAPRNKFNLGAFFGPFDGVRGSVEYAWRGQYTAPAIWYAITTNFADPRVHPLDAYGRLNARASYDLPLRLGGRDRTLRLSIIGNNLTDETPRETLIGVDTTVTGREVFGQVELHF